MSEEIYTELTEILRDVFDDDDLVATPELSAVQVEGWDSLANVRLFLAIEGAFGIRFSTGEISSIESLGEMVETIAAKQNK